MNNEMTNKKTNTPLFKVKCVDDDSSNLTLGKEYVVVGCGNGFYTIENDIGVLQYYHQFRFEIVYLSSKDNQEYLNVGDNSLDYHPLSPQEVVQATLDGKELEIQYTDGTRHRMLPTATTLRNLTLLNFRLKLSLEDKRKAVIKKLLESKVAVLCKCWGVDGIGETIVAITRIDDDYTYPYMNNWIAYKNAYAIDDNGNEIINV